MSDNPPPITPETFLARYPEFGNAAQYPGSLIQIILDEAIPRLDPLRWSTLLFKGLALYTAHQLALGRRRFLEAQAGAIPGTTGGVVSAKSAGGLSLTFDTGACTEEGAAFWNLTNYGTEFYRLMQQAGMGGFVDPEVLVTSNLLWWQMGGFYGLE